jgi:small nuclear ribonucleoprotein (snRNP)-like protein
VRVGHRSEYTNSEIQVRRRTDKMTDLKKLKGKQVKIFLTNAFVYKGKLVNVGLHNLELNDIKEGKIFLNLNSIRSVQELKWEK